MDMTHTHIIHNTIETKTGLKEKRLDIKMKSESVMSLFLHADMLRKLWDKFRVDC